jgi:hypothetical protein
MTTEDRKNPPIAELAARHGVSEGAVRVVLEALRSGGGTMAQFSHPEFGGMAQWSSGMTMVGDMFNDRMKATLNELATDLAGWLREHPEARDRPAGRTTEVSYRSSSGSTSWWPEKLGQPSSTGAQNHLRYAIFPEARRLAIDDGGRRSVYDTGDHRISGISQAQSADATITFTSQNGLVRVSDLKRIEE